VKSLASFEMKLESMTHGERSQIGPLDKLFSYTRAAGPPETCMISASSVECTAALLWEKGGRNTRVFHLGKKWAKAPDFVDSKPKLKCRKSPTTAENMVKRKAMSKQES